MIGYDSYDRWKKMLVMKKWNTPEIVLPGDEKMIGMDERDGVIWNKWTGISIAGGDKRKKMIGNEKRKIHRN